MLRKTPSVTIAPRDPIKSPMEYYSAQQSAKKSFREKLPKKSDSAPLMLIARELARLPSAASRRYGLALAQVLVPYGEKALDESVFAGGSSKMTYTEMAQVHALTDCLFFDWYCESTVPKGAFPYQARLDLCRAAIEYCPNDMALGWPLLAMVAVTGDESFQPCPKLMDAKTVQQVNANFRLFFHRITDPTRPANLTTLWAATGMSGAGELLYCYRLTIDDPTGHDFRDLFSSLREVVRRNRRLDTSENGRKMVAAYLTVDAGWQQYLERIDLELAKARDVKPTLRRFFEAMSRNDVQTMARLLSPECGSTPAELRARVLGRDGTAVEVERVYVPYGSGPLEVQVIIREPQRTLRRSFSTDAASMADGWKITVMKDHDKE